MKRLLLSLLLILPAGFLAEAQIAKDFTAAADSLRTLLKERTTVDTDLKIDRVMKRGNTLDFYFNACLADYPWRKEDRNWFLGRLKALFPAGYGAYQTGQIFARRLAFEDLLMPALTYDGRPADDAFRVADPRGTEAPLVSCPDEMQFPQGLSGRNIALWQSHGRYYEESTDRWEWQRGALFRTVEDMYTQSYVLPFLIPMLENAGAYVMTPRERDTQVHEVICDNDEAFKGPRTELVRRAGEYRESGKWQDAGEGFADLKETYLFGENPFRMGTARKAEVSDGRKAVRAEWIPDIPERGMYAVYVSYKSLPNSTESAHYTVHHLGGDTDFFVNQKIGGGTWIYLGTFEFAAGEEGYVALENSVPDGRTSYRSGSVVTADAVKFGGGMGKVARGFPGNETVSGMPAFTEGAMYWMQWAGIDASLYKEEWESDYTKDYAGRGAWVTHMAGGSRSVPDGAGRGVPFDLSLAFHSDAGVHQQDSTVGTLSIYTLQCDDSQKLPDGTSRYVCRALADYVQSQVVGDIRAEFEPLWNRRQLWDRSYSESRTTSVPGMLLELLSHQNFADMKYGLDPSFRFAVSRAVYKGMLKFLSNRYGCSYAVQPLPVHDFAVSFADDRMGAALLSWLPAEDRLEPTARPDGYLLRTRTDGGAFGPPSVLSVTERNGKCTARVPIEPGHLYSFQIIAYNGGGKSFPSETLSIGVPERAKPSEKVLIVNNFTRISAPAWFDTPQYAGFDDALDSGMPYRYEINYIGSQYEFRRDLPWLDDDCPGFGGSWTHEAGKLVPGNTFDFPAVHGKALMQSGYPFCSVSAEAFAREAALRRGYLAADIICGKQVTTPVGRRAVPDRYQVFPDRLQAALRDFTGSGGNVLISGAHIGTDAWYPIYPFAPDSLYVERTKEFIQQVLGYRWLTNYPTAGESISVYRNSPLKLKGTFGFHRLRNSEVYAAETPDGLVPASKEAETFLRYSDTQISAGVCYSGPGYRTVCLGFPIEVISSGKDIERLISAAMKYFGAGAAKPKN